MLVTWWFPASVRAGCGAASSLVLGTACRRLQLIADMPGAAGLCVNGARWLACLLWMCDV